VDRQKLIDAALEIGGTFTIEFVRRCAVDFPDLLKELNYFEPSEKSAWAAQTFVVAAGEIRGFLKEEEALALTARANQLTDRHIENREVIIPHLYYQTSAAKAADIRIRSLLRLLRWPNSGKQRRRLFQLLSILPCRA
jgi:hypothetical protein